MSKKQIITETPVRNPDIDKGKIKEESFVPPVRDQRPPPPPPKDEK